jgi:hypothetical protein
VSQKRQFFAEIFGENIFKIITSVPGLEPVILRKNANALTASKRPFCLTLCIETNVLMTNENRQVHTYVFKYRMMIWSA